MRGRKGDSAEVTITGLGSHRRLKGTHEHRCPTATGPQLYRWEHVSHNAPGDDGVVSITGGDVPGAALGRGRAEQQSHGRSHRPAPALPNPTSTAPHQPERFRGDSRKSQDRPPGHVEL